MSSEMLGLNRTKDFEIIMALIKRKVPGPRLIEVMEVMMVEPKLMY